MKFILGIFIGLVITTNLYAQQPKEENNPTTSIRVTLPCFNSAKLAKDLKETYKEVPIAMGLADDAAGSTMSLWINPSNRSWTLVATHRDTSCVIGTGGNITIIPLSNGKGV